MSGIIWGFINKKGKEVSPELGISMMDYMLQYKIDRYKYTYHKNVFMGCGLQYITEESEREILPYYDEENKVFITADAIIDNREELIKLLELNIADVSELTDSEYILLAYKKWNNECIKYLIGDFSFVIFDENKDEVFCAKDHVGKRTFYYVNNENYFGFCTVANPLIVLMKEKASVNQRWLSDYISLTGVAQVSEEKEYILNEINQLPFANIMILKDGNLKISRYWNPEKDIKPLKLKDEKAYIEEFRRIFSEAVNCRCRAKGNVGIKLSSGLDSSAVSVFAAQNLKKVDKKLKSYTVVPKKGFTNNYPKSLLPDETELVKELVDYVQNIDAKFCDCLGADSITCIEDLLLYLEQPYKFIENSYWLYEFTKLAEKDGCRVMLTGQFGNSTISYGNCLDILKTFLCEGRLLRLNSEVNNINRLSGYSRKKLYFDILKSILPHKCDRNVNYFKYSPISDEMKNKWDIEKRFKEDNITGQKIKVKNIKQFRKGILDPKCFNQLSVSETKIGLSSGVLDRDPTRDKRVIEFCMSVPSTLFLKDGYSRYLIRAAMKGLLPDSIRLHVKSKGVQAADWLERLEDKWDDIFKEIKVAINDPILREYLDVDYLNNNLSSIQIINKDSNLLLVRMYLIVLILYRYRLKNEEKFKLAY